MKVARYEVMTAESVCKENTTEKQRENFTFVRLVSVLLLSVGGSFSGYANADLELPKGPKYAIDDTRWVSLGMGFRGSGVWVENRGTDSYRSDFSIDNARVYVN